jgi:hypothetical protein
LDASVSKLHDSHSTPSQKPREKKQETRKKERQTSRKNENYGLLLFDSGKKKTAPSGLPLYTKEKMRAEKKHRL